MNRLVAQKPFVVATVLVLGAFTYALTSVAGEKREINLDAWVNVQPVIAAAVIDYGHFDVDLRTDPELTKDPDDDGNPHVRIKVGYRYNLETYDLPARVAWMGEVFWSPERAAARRLFDMYDPSAMSSEDWGRIRVAFEDNPSRMIFVTIEDGSYVGTPVKWNKQIADMMGDAITIAERSQGPGAFRLTSGVVNIVMANVIGEAMRETHGLISSDIIRPLALDADYEAAINWLEAQAKGGDNADMLALYGSANGPFYVGFSDVPDELQTQPVEQLITYSGAYGQPLGAVMPSWPSND